LLIDRQGVLWAGLNDGLLRYDGSNWNRFNKSNGLTYEYVHAIAEDSQGVLWLGGTSGILTYDGHNWKNLQTGTHGSINAIFRDSKGNMWVATDKGLNRYDGTKWETFTKKDGLAGNEVMSIAEDNEGNLWFGTGDRGVSRFSPD
jgi:ligand-binding sensor domain-containing protein